MGILGITKYCVNISKGEIWTPSAEYAKLIGLRILGALDSDELF